MMALFLFLLQVVTGTTGIAAGAVKKQVASVMMVVVAVVLEMKNNAGLVGLPSAL